MSPERPDLVDWLIRVRRLALSAQAVLLLVAFATGERPVTGLVLFVLFTLGEISRSLLFGVRGDGRTGALANGVGLTALLIAWGEPHQPLSVFYLVDAALLATFAERREAWVACALAVAGQGIASFAPPLLGTASHSEAPVHLLAHVATFASSAVAVTHFLGGVAEEKRRQAEALREANENQERSARLAAIGTLAAGVAHEIATPLGSIELLAEEIASDPEALTALRRELQRCRSILDRMLARGSPAEGRTEGVEAKIIAWVEAWRHAHPQVDVALDVTRDVHAEAMTARGSPEGWRTALWTVLDNAMTAGPPVRLSLSRTERTLSLHVDDSGDGIDPEVAERIGEPFLSRWPSTRGAGLGLYVAYTFARGTGGHLQLATREGGGCRVVLQLPLDTSHRAENQGIS